MDQSICPAPPEAASSSNTPSTVSRFDFTANESAETAKHEHSDRIKHITTRTQRMVGPPVEFHGDSTVSGIGLTEGKLCVPLGSGPYGEVTGWGFVGTSDARAPN